MIGGVALLLHAHLPYVRHPEHGRPLEERWLHEAIWECYLPLLDVLRSLARDGVRAPFTISVSPTLAAMLGDDFFRRRFDDFLGRLERLASGARRHVPAEMGAVLDFYRERLRASCAAWDRLGGDVLGAVVAHARAERVELWTTSVTHAYLPGLARTASQRAQIRLGLAAFEAATGERARGFWLPECAFAPGLDHELAAAGATVSVVDAHGVELAHPRPPRGISAPLLTPAGVAFFGRDPDVSEDVWSRRVGYPGHPSYRDFYRDAGFDLPSEALDGELGPRGERLMTGLKLHRITGQQVDKAIYAPAVAEAQARVHAADFIARRTDALASAPRGQAPPILLAPFDAELFGHWWFEGPTFFEAVLRGLAEAARDGGPAAVTPAAFLEQWPALEVAEPAASSWGEGGFGAVWTGPDAARLWRHVHHVESRVLVALAAARASDGLGGRALDQALVELLLLESSDWAFMLSRGEMVEYAEQRVRAHATRALRLAAIALSGTSSDDDKAFLAAVEQRDPFLERLRGEPLRAAFDDVAPSKRG